MRLPEIPEDEEALELLQHARPLAARFAFPHLKFKIFQDVHFVWNPLLGNHVLRDVCGQSQT